MFCGVRINFWLYYRAYSRCYAWFKRKILWLYEFKTIKRDIITLITMKLFNMYLHIMICCNNFPPHVHIMYKFIRTYIKFYTILFDIATTHLLFVGVIHLQTYFSLLKFNERIIFFLSWLAYVMLSLVVTVFLTFLAHIKYKRRPHERNVIYYAPINRRSSNYCSKTWFFRTHYIGLF